jgi:multiple antibiotic resistance protein
MAGPEGAGDGSYNGAMADFAQFFGLSFSALFPVINPIGSALVFVGMVGFASGDLYKKLARKIAVITALFLLAIDVGGAAILKVFGISLPIVQLTGGLVVAALGWGLLNQKEASDPGSVAAAPADMRVLQKKIFYPFTFPITAGPGVLVVTLTLSAHASKGELLHVVFAQLGIVSGMVLNCVVVFLVYAYAPMITAKVSPATAHGILRVIAFVLLCIGAQIAWNGVVSLAPTVHFAPR